MKVTIAIPFFNDGKYLRYAIQSVLNQSFEDFELILINDGSHDNSSEIAACFAAIDHRVKIVDDGVNMGLAYRLNQSINMASGEYYVRMDADDIMYYDRLKIQLDYLEDHPDVSVLGSSCMLINDKNDIVGSCDMSLKHDVFIHPTVMAKTKWFKENPYAEWCVRCQDKELWLRTSAKNMFVNLKQPLLFYRESGTVSYTKYSASQRYMRAVLSHYDSYGKGFLWYAKSLIKSYLSVALYFLLAKVGRIDLLVEKRNRKPLEPACELTIRDLKVSYSAYPATCEDFLEVGK